MAKKKAIPPGCGCIRGEVYPLRSMREYQQTPPRIRAPPRICRTAGISPKRKAAITAAATGSQSLDADTKEGEK